MALIHGIRRMFGGGRNAQSASNGPLPPAAAPIVVASTATAAATPTLVELKSVLDQLSARLERDADGLAELRSTLAPLATLPESVTEVRRSAMTLNETFAEHAERSRRSSDGSNALLQRVGDSLMGQAEVVGGLQEQMEAMVRTFGGVGEDLDRLRASIGQVAEHGGRSANSLSELVESQSRRELALADELRHFRAWILGLLAVIAVAVVVAAVACVMAVAQQG
jgi:hypothetical protein